MVIGLSQESVGAGALRYARRRNFQMDGGGFEVSGLYQRSTHFIVGPGGIGLQFDGFVKVFDGLRVLLLSGVSHSQTVLREEQVGLLDGDLLQRGGGFLGTSVVYGNQG